MASKRSKVSKTAAEEAVRTLLRWAGEDPQRRIMLLFPPIPMPAWLFVTLYGLLELTLGVTGTNDGVAHFAHLGGMAAGFVLLTNWGWKLRRR